MQRAPRPLRPRDCAGFYREAQWQRTSEATANLTGDVVVNLAKLNLSKLEANIAQAEATLGVENPTQVYVLVDHGWTGKADSVAIHVLNESARTPS